MPRMTQAGYTPPKQEKIWKKPDPKPTPKRKKKKKLHRMNEAMVLSLVILAVAVGISAGILYVYGQTKPYQTTFKPGTFLQGQPLAGKTQEEAVNLLAEIEAKQVNTWQAEISCEDQVYTLTASDIGLTVDREATLLPLWEAGRSGNMFTQYRDMLKMSREPMIVNPVLLMQEEPLQAWLEEIQNDVKQDAVDARVSFQPGDAEPFVFTEEKAGRTLDIAGVLEQIEAQIQKLNPIRMTLKADAIQPDVSRAELEQAIELRSRVVVAIEGDAASVQNVRLVAEKLHGLRIDAEQILSFNESVGARTAEAGYQVAEEPAYGTDGYGEPIVGIGGGICQASTALYRAALLANLDIVERKAAVRPVSYCDMGQEAVVSAQGLDLKIRNQTAHALFISARVYEKDGAFLEIMLIGEPLLAKYSLHSDTEALPLIEEPVYVRDKEGRYAVYTDERVPVGQAVQGYSVCVERIRTDENGEQNEVISEMKYESLPPTIYVGVQER